MSGRRKRSTFTPEVKAEALRIALEHGANVASDRLGINAATIRSWVNRAGVTAVTVERSAEVEASDLEAKPAEALSVNEWVELQRLTEQRFRRSLASGSPSDARWHAISLGITTDKLKAAREVERAERPGSPDVAASSERLASIIDSIRARRLATFSSASVDQLRVELNRTRHEYRKQRRRVKWLLREMLIRRQGGPSLFRGVVEGNLPEPWDVFTDDDWADVVKVDTVVQPPVRPSPYVRYSPEPDPIVTGTDHAIGNVQGTVPAEDEPDEPAEIAVVTPIARARRRSSWGRSRQQEILRQQGIDERLFRPPGA